MMAILTGVMWYPIVVLICISLFFFKFYFIFKLYIIVLVLPNIKMNPPQVYMCWASFHVFVSHLYVSLEKCLFRSFSHFLIGLFVFLVFSSMSCMYILEINPLSVVSFAVICSHSEGCLFTLLIVSFAVQKLLSLIRPYLFTLVFISVTLGSGS